MRTTTCQLGGLALAWMLAGCAPATATAPSAEERPAASATERSEGEGERSEAQAEGSEAQAEEPVLPLWWGGFESAPEALSAFPQLDVAKGTVPAPRALAAIQAALNGQDPAARAEARAAAQGLITDSPHHRAAAQVPVVIDAVLDRHENAELGPLRATLDAHLEVLRLLGVDSVEAPAPGSPLSAHLPNLPNAAALRRDPDPIQTTLRLFSAADATASAATPAERARIEANTAALSVATLGQWPMQGSLGALRASLATLAAESGDPALRRDAAALVELLDARLNEEC